MQSYELVEVCGPNGSGKTTLLRMFAGFLKPDSGHVVRHTKGLGFVGHRLGVARLLSVRENIRWSIAMSNTTNTEARTQEVLERFGLGSCVDTLVKDLSAGQAKRTALAVLVLSNHQLWLLDEPLASLDTEGEELLGQAVKTHCQSGGAAIVATHSSFASKADQRFELGKA